MEYQHGQELIIIMIASMAICLLFMIITQVVFWRKRKLARKLIITDWASFIKAIEANDINLIHLYGNKLIWNRYIGQEQIDKLNITLFSRLENHPELLSLYEVTKTRRSYLSDDERRLIYGEVSDVTKTSL